MPYNFIADSFHTGVTAEALRVKIERKSAILHQRGHIDPKNFWYKGSPPPINFTADSFHTKKLCSRLSSSGVQFYTETADLHFCALPLFGWLRGTVRCSS